MYRGEVVQQPLFLTHTVVSVGNDSTSSTSFVKNNGIGSVSITVPAAATYLVHVDLATYMSVISAVPRSTYFQLKCNGTIYGPSTVGWDFATTGAITGPSWRAPCPMTLGSNTFEIWWRTFDITSTANTNGNCRCILTVGSC